MAIAYLITFILFAAFSFILTYTDFPEKFISIVVIIATIVGILVASSFVTRTIRSNGWLSGIITGLLYVGIVYLIGYLIFERFSINTLNALPFIIAIIIGALGGVIGINMKRK